MKIDFIMITMTRLINFILHWFSNRNHEFIRFFTFRRAFSLYVQLNILNRSSVHVLPFARCFIQHRNWVISFLCASFLDWGFLIMNIGEEGVTLNKFAKIFKEWFSFSGFINEIFLWICVFFSRKFIFLTIYLLFYLLD